MVQHRPTVEIAEASGDYDHVATEKARSIAATMDGPVLVDDTTLDFHSWGLFPGSAVKPFCHGIGVENVPTLLRGFPSAGASPRCCMA